MQLTTSAYRARQWEIEGVGERGGDVGLKEEDEEEEEEVASELALWEKKEAPESNYVRFASKDFIYARDTRQWNGQLRAYIHEKNSRPIATSTFGSLFFSRTVV